MSCTVCEKAIKTNEFLEPTEDTLTVYRAQTRETYTFHLRCITIANLIGLAT